jgi:hypothetical protein
MHKKQVWFILSLAAVAALTLVSGVLQGRIRNRWGPSESARAAAKKLQDVPRRFGGPQNDRWQLQSSETMSRDSVEMLECTGYFVRTYANQRTGEVVSIFVVVGPAGPIAVHTPEICYPSRNYKSRGTRERVAIPDGEGQEHQFWALTFKSTSVQENLNRVYYAWSTGDRWSAPDDARFAFVGWPYLYKIQLSSNLPRETDLKTGDTCREFLKDFVPAARRYLIEPSRR